MAVAVTVSAKAVLVAVDIAVEVLVLVLVLVAVIVNVLVAVLTGVIVFVGVARLLAPITTTIPRGFVLTNVVDWLLTSS